MITCYIAKDLIPNYIDGLLSEETAQDFQTHLADCDECRLLFANMEKSVSYDVPMIENNLREINFLKKLKRNVSKLKIIAVCVSVVFALLAGFVWLFAIGTPVSSSDIEVITEIQHPDAYQTYLGQEWVVHLSLTNGKAIVPWTKAVYITEADGRKLPAGAEINLTEVPAVNWMHESPSFTYGYSVDGNTPPERDFTVTVRLKDKEIVYSMSEEGLFQPQQ